MFPTVTNMDSHDKIRGENYYICWGIYSFHARNTMSSMELLEMSIILKQPNAACENNGRIIMGRQQQHRTFNCFQTGDFSPKQHIHMLVMLL